MKISVFIALVCIFSGNLFAAVNNLKDRDLTIKRDFDKSVKEKQVDTVKWVGITRCDTRSHTTDHNHRLKFIRDKDQKEFDIVDSPKITNLHCKSESNYLVEIEGEKTSQFLFWGGNLKVNKFKVIKQITQNRIPHNDPVEREKFRALKDIDRFNHRRDSL